MKRFIVNILFFVALLPITGIAIIMNIYLGITCFIMEALSRNIEYYQPLEYLGVLTRKLIRNMS